MDKKEFLKRAVGEVGANGFFQSTAGAVAVNPNIWDYNLKKFIEQSIIVTPLAEQIDFRSPGVDFKVTIDLAPSIATAQTDTSEVAVSAFSTRNLTMTPAEYGARYQITKGEAVRAFFNVAEKMVSKLGYSMALKKESLAISTLTASTNNVIVNSKTAVTAIASTDTFNMALLAKGIQSMKLKYYKPKYLVINPVMENALLNTANLYKANEFGSRDVIANGYVTTLYGVQVFVSDVLSTGTSAKAILLGETKTGEKAFGYAVKRDPAIERQYFAATRLWDIVGTEEYGFSLFHEDAVFTLQCYAA